MENGKFYNYVLHNCEFFEFNMRFSGDSFVLDYEKKSNKRFFNNKKEQISKRVELYGECISGTLYDVVTGKKIRDFEELSDEEKNFEKDSKWLSYNYTYEVSAIRVKESLEKMTKEDVFCYKEYMEYLEEYPLKAYKKKQLKKTLEEEAKQYIKEFQKANK